VSGARTRGERPRPPAKVSAPEPARCFTCDRVTVLVAGHKVCEDCHGSRGKCGQCGHLQPAAVAA